MIQYFFWRDKTMKKTTTIIAAILLFIILSLLSGCKPVTDELPKDSESKNYSDIYEPKVFIEELKALPVSTRNDQIEVLDSYTDNNRRNHYLLDSGSVDQLYLSTLASIYYDGNPICIKVTKNESKTISDSVSSTVSRLYSYNKSKGLSLSAGTKAGVEIGGGIKKSVEFSIETTSSTSWSTSSTDSKSTTNTKSFIEEYARQIEVNYDIGKDEMESGYYRYAIFAKCDLYFDVETSESNDILYSLKIITCVREDSIFFKMQFSIDGIFDNSSDQKLNLSEDFYKYLPKTKRQPKSPESMRISPNNRQIATVTDSTRDSYFKFDMTETADILKTYNLAIRRIDVFVHIKEKDDGYQELYLIQQNNPNYGWRDNTHVFDDEITLFKKQDIETAPGKKGEGDYSVYQNVFIKRGDLCDSWYLYCGAHGRDGDTWEASNVSIIIYFEQL